MSIFGEYSFECPRCKKRSKYSYCPDCGTKTVDTGRAKFEDAKERLNERYRRKVIDETLLILDSARLIDTHIPPNRKIFSLALNCVQEVEEYNPYDLDNGVFVVKPDAIDAYEKMLDRATKLYEIIFSWLLIDGIQNPIFPTEGETNV